MKRFAFAPLLVLMALTAGCETPVPRYAAPQLPAELVAKLKVGSFVTLKRIDGADPVDISPFGPVFDLHPGVRELVVLYSENQGQYSIVYEAVLRFDFKAGREYRVRRYGARDIELVDRLEKKRYIFDQDPPRVEPLYPSAAEKTSAKETQKTAPKPAKW